MRRIKKSNVVSDMRIAIGLCMVPKCEDGEKKSKVSATCESLLAGGELPSVRDVKAVNSVSDVRIVIRLG